MADPFFFVGPVSSLAHGGLFVPDLVLKIEWFGLAWLGWTVLYFAFLFSLFLSFCLSYPLFSLACCIFAK
jgi:hypothetical protein